MKANICRNFQRGSCNYGERCKFLHTQQQQQQRKPNVNGFGGQSNSQNTNPFGFGSNSGSNQQQKTNPFGFGMQKSSQLNGGPQSEFKPNQFQPFENKWNRSSSTPQNGTSSSRQSDNNSQQANHKCTDPEVCKRQIAEDFAQEKPLWLLTCYSHCKGTPCDIVGDISYEELRAAAYEDAKKGMNLQSIVEKERNILKSKLVEFNKLLSEPYKRPLNSSLNIPNHQSNGANTNAFSLTTPNNGPVSVSSFSQLGTSLNSSSERPSAPQMNTPAQPSSFGNGGNFMTSNTTNLFDSRISGPQTQSSPFSKPAELTMFGDLTSQFQTPRNPFSIPVELPTCPGSTCGQFQDPSAFNNSNNTTMLQTTPDVQLNKSQVENESVDPSIWLKEKWIPGEIPEEAPPDRFVWETS